MSDRPSWRRSPHPGDDADAAFGRAEADRTAERPSTERLAPERTQLWTFTVGADPAVLRVTERRAAEGAVHARWHDPTKTGGDRRGRRSLGVTVRDASGELDPVLVEEAEARAYALYAQLFPFAAAGPPPGGWLALEVGLAHALIDGAAFAGGPAHLRAVRRHARELVRVFGADTSWAALDPDALRRAWQRLARERNSERSPDREAVRQTHSPHGHQHGAQVARRAPEHGGLGSARGMFVVLFAAAAWLRAEGLIPPGGSVAPPGWRRLLAADWRALAALAAMLDE